MGGKRAVDGSMMNQDPRRDQGVMTSVELQSSSEKDRRFCLYVFLIGRHDAARLNAHHRFHPLYVLTCTIIPPLQAEKGIGQVHPARHSPDRILQFQYIVVFLDRSEVMVLHARVSGSRIRVYAHKTGLDAQSE